MIREPEARGRPPLTMKCLAFVTLSALGLCACSSDSEPVTPGGDAGADVSAPGPDAGADSASDSAPDTGAGLGIAGVVQDQAGVPVASAKLEVGGASVFSDPDG